MRSSTTYCRNHSSINTFINSFTDQTNPQSLQWFRFQQIYGRKLRCKVWNFLKKQFTKLKQNTECNNITSHTWHSTNCMSPNNLTLYCKSPNTVTHCMMHTQKISFLLTPEMVNLQMALTKLLLAILKMKHYIYSIPYYT